MLKIKDIILPRHAGLDPRGAVAVQEWWLQFHAIAARLRGMSYFNQETLKLAIASDGLRVKPAMTRRGQF